MFPQKPCADQTIYKEYRSVACDRTVFFYPLSPKVLCRFTDNKKASETFSLYSALINKEHLNVSEKNTKKTGETLTGFSITLTNSD